MKLILKWQSSTLNIGLNSALRTRPASTFRSSVRAQRLSYCVTAQRSQARYFSTYMQVVWDEQNLIVVTSFGEYDDRKAPQTSATSQ